MKSKKLLPFFRGLSSIMASVMTLSMLGTTVADTYRSNLDDVLGTQSYITLSDEENAKYQKDYATIEDMAAAAKDISVREGEEGTVIMKNDNEVFPLGNSVALFGLAAYAPYPYSAGDLKAGNDDAVDLVASLTEAGVEINQTVSDFYVNNLLNAHEEVTQNAWTGEDEVSIAYDHIYTTSVGDMTEFQISEVPSSKYEELGAPSDMASTIDKDNTTAICVFARAGGESNTYAPGSALDFEGNATGADPLALSADELSVIDYAKETCSKVIVLLNTGNTMLINDIVAGGAHEVDGIAYIGCPNDYQFTGIVNVLTGKANSTGALTDTYVRDNASIPAVQNFGGDYYADYQIVAANAENGFDDRYPNQEISNDSSTGSFGGGGATYSAGQYIVEAEGIYVGYKYYETRYFDSIMNPDFNAASAAGSTQGDAWNYNQEVIYPFGYTQSYLDYTQTVQSVEVDKTPEGNITAVVDVTNNSDTDGKFLAQLYVQQPYTQYDMENNVEKSAVMFLNSAKVDVAAGATESVTITIPTKYLASYDYTTAKTYILDEGDYYFTAAAGSHEAVNNFLGAQGKTTADGMDAEATGTAVVWNGNETLDTTTFAIENGTEVTNVVDDADLNYWTGDDTVTYLSRSDWEGTFPINYNTDVEVKIGDSEKSAEWIAALRGQQYTIQTDSPATEGVDSGVRFNTEDIQYDQMNDINDDVWNTLVSQITIDEAVGAVIHGGNQSDILTNVENPSVSQNEGVNGFTAAYTDEETGKSYHFNVNSMTLLGSSFNPELAYDWGIVEGNSGLWLEKFDVWGIGLTQRRTPYNGRNYEYVSEDPMLTNRVGYGVLNGCAEKGVINGPKHMGFNDQEHNRNGVAAYMNEQKFRETDLRCFQGALEDGNGMAVMVAFNRIGATNASHSVGMLKTILRDEWGFTGIVSTDMMNNNYYFNPESMVMATVTQVADFGGDDNHINLGDGGVDSVWAYISMDSVENDSTLVEQARQDLKYQLYTFANSAVMNVSTEQVAVWWDTLLKMTTIIAGILAAVGVIGWAALSIMPAKKKEEE